MVLVLLALLDGRLVLGKISVSGEALHTLPVEIAIRHRVPNDANSETPLGKNAPHLPRHRTLAGSRSDRSHSDHRLRRLQHRRRRNLQRSSRRHRPSSKVHDVGMRNVRIGEDHFVDPVLGYERLEPLFSEDRDAVGVAVSRQLRRIATVIDIRDLGRRESNDLGVGVVAQRHVEVVEVAPGRPEDECAAAHL